MSNKYNTLWHELNVGDTVLIKKEKDSEEFAATVLSFRKVMAITLCTTGQYELFEPKEFNEFYSAALINEA